MVNDWDDIRRYEQSGHQAIACRIINTLRTIFTALDEESKIKYVVLLNRFDFFNNIEMMDLTFMGSFDPYGNGQTSYSSSSLESEALIIRHEGVIRECVLSIGVMIEMSKRLDIVDIVSFMIASCVRESPLKSLSARYIMYIDKADRDYQLDENVIMAHQVVYISKRKGMLTYHQEVKGKVLYAVHKSKRSHTSWYTIDDTALPKFCAGMDIYKFDQWAGQTNISIDAGLSYGIGYKPWMINAYVTVTDAAYVRNAYDMYHKWRVGEGLFESLLQTHDVLTHELTIGKIDDVHYVSEHEVSSHYIFRKRLLYYAERTCDHAAYTDYTKELILNGTSLSTLLMGDDSPFDADVNWMMHSAGIIPVNCFDDYLYNIAKYEEFVRSD